MDCYKFKCCDTLAFFSAVIDWFWHLVLLLTSDRYLDGKWSDSVLIIFSFGYSHASYSSLPRHIAAHSDVNVHNPAHIIFPYYIFFFSPKSQVCCKRTQESLTAVVLWELVVSQRCKERECIISETLQESWGFLFFFTVLLNIWRHSFQTYSLGLLYPSGVIYLKLFSSLFIRLFAFNLCHSCYQRVISSDFHWLCYFIYALYIWSRLSL